MKAFNVIALDKDFQVVSLLRSTNLQWSRKYYEAGTFSVQIPIEQYSPDIKYIYTKSRPEIGKVIQKNYLNQRKYKNIQLSGYFLEKELDRHVVYHKGTSNITNGPEWIESSGKAEDVAYSFFEAFKQISTDIFTSNLGILSAGSQGRGKKAVHTRNGEYLGKKIYDILKPSEMSYIINYDFVNNAKKFSVWSGVDRTEGNAGNNNPVIFSTKYGNIKEPNILISEENYKNACIVSNEQINGETSSYTTRAVLKENEDTEIQFLSLMSSLSKNDYTDVDFLAALENESFNELENHQVLINVEFDAMEGSYEYMVDFDKGDKCSLEFPEMNLSLQAVLIGCYEVIKSGKWTMTMEFGEPVIVRR